MKVIILGGFLGSGKTTFLMRLAEYISAKRTDTEKTDLVIIENEIGEVSVDGEMLGGYEVKELFSGCICCTLTADLTVSIKQIYKDYAPEYIIVEATGLAYPDKIKETLLKYASEECEKITALVLADASRWYELIDCMEVFAVNQIKSADVILLNKTDLVDDETARNIAAELRAIKPDSDIYALNAKENADEIIEGILGK